MLFQGCAAVCTWAPFSIWAASTHFQAALGLTVSGGSRDLHVWSIYYFIVEEQSLILAAAFLCFLASSFTQPSSVSFGSPIETPSTFPKLPVPCCAGSSKGLLWEGVGVLVVIVACCMTTNLLMWKHCLGFSCHINALFCAFQLYIQHCLLFSSVWFLCV